MQFYFDIMICNYDDDLKIFATFVTTCFLMIQKIVFTSLVTTDTVRTNPLRDTQRISCCSCCMWLLTKSCRVPALFCLVTCKLCRAPFHRLNHSCLKEPLQPTLRIAFFKNKKKKQTIFAFLKLKISHRLDVTLCINEIFLENSELIRIFLVKF